jgi:uncharacterized membrane protein YjfL (UPF0719 family)
MDGFDPKTLTEEKSLARIAWRCRVLPWNRFNVIITGLAALFSMIYASASVRPHSSFAEWDRLLASAGLAFGGQVLGFLIAGFTIFATLTKPALFKRMAVVTHEETGLSYLKYNFFAFVQVFIQYLCFTATSLVFMVAGPARGPASEIVERISENNESAKVVVTRIAFCLLFTWSVYVLALLKSFIFNIYHVVMTAIRWEFECPEADAPKTHDSKEQTFVDQHVTK